MFVHHQLELVLLHGCEALTAVDGTVSAGLEGNLGLAAAVFTDHSEHLTGSIAVLSSTLCSAALGAAAGLVLETLFSEESLLRSREDKFASAISTSKCFVLVHGKNLLLLGKNDIFVAYPHARHNFYGLRHLGCAIPRRRESCKADGDHLLF